MYILLSCWILNSPHVQGKKPPQRASEFVTGDRLFVLLDPGLLEMSDQLARDSQLPRGYINGKVHRATWGDLQAKAWWRVEPPI